MLIILWPINADHIVHPLIYKCHTVCHVRPHYINVQICSQMNKHIPSKEAHSPKHKPWITREIIMFIHRCNMAYKAWKRNRTAHNHQKFIKLHSKCQANIGEAHTQYTNNIFNLGEPRTKPIPPKDFGLVLNPRRRTPATPHHSDRSNRVFLFFLNGCTWQCKYCKWPVLVSLH